mgnify:CR=1 FL=1
MAKSLLSRRSVLLAGLETTYGVNPGLVADDALLVNEPSWSPDISTLERNFDRDDLSQLAHQSGRKMAQITFSTELKGSGRQNSGQAGDVPRLGRLLRACGFAETLRASPEVVSPWRVGLTGHTATPASFSVDSTGVATLDTMMSYLIEVTDDSSGAEKIKIVPDDTARESEQTGVSFDTGFAVPLGSSGGAVTPTHSGLTVGQKWLVWVLPTGVSYTPISETFESVSLELYKDGKKHELTGSFGTFEISAETDGFPSLSFTFTGVYHRPVDASIGEPLAPSSPMKPNYETTRPAAFELARIRVDDVYAPVINSFSFDLGVTVTPRPDANASNGLGGFRITDRQASGGIDPEARLTADHDFWQRMEDARQMPLQIKNGTVRGNTTWILAPGAQYTGLSYSDRDGIMTHDAGLRFPRVEGNDEVTLLFQ